MNVFLGERLYAPGQGTALQGGLLAGCPDIRPDGIYVDGRRVITLGLRGVGVGDVGDLLAYRQEWEPFIKAHLELWEYVNGVLERMEAAKNCPRGIFEVSQISSNLNEVEQTVCTYLLWSRVYTSDTHPLGIRPQWNAWKGKTSAEIVNGAGSMLEWHQKVVMDVGGPYAERLLGIGKTLDFEIDLPNVPEFTVQQEIRARIEAAYVTTKGILQIAGYGAQETLKKVGSIGEAVAEGLQETARKLPQAVPTAWTWIGVTAVLAVVGGGLLIYYRPRKALQGA